MLNAIRTLLSTIVVYGLVLTCTAFSAHGQEPARTGTDGGNRRQIVVGTKHAPPFSMKDKEGNWTGISIDIFEDVARELNLEYQFQEFDLKWLLQGVEKGSLDAAIAAITMTPQREAALDFTYPYFYTGLGVAVSSSYEKSQLRELMSQVFSAQSLQYVAGIILSSVLLICLLLLLNVTVESRGKFATKMNRVHNRTLDHRILGFRTAAKWLVSNLYGRTVGVIWLSVTIVVIYFYQPEMVELTTLIERPQDLKKIRVGTISNSSTMDYLKKLGIKNVRKFESIDHGLTAVARDEITAFVYDRPMLKYYVREDSDQEVVVLDLQFEPQGYGIALPAGSNMREELNKVLLNRLSSETYIRKISEKYLGELR